MNIEYESIEYANQLKLLYESTPMKISTAKTLSERSNVVYAISDPNDNEIIYVGETKNFSTRMNNHCMLKGFHHGTLTYDEVLCYNVRNIRIDGKRNRLFLECYIISILNPKCNHINH